MTVKFIAAGEVVDVLQNYDGPEPQVGDKIYLEEFSDYEVYEVIRRSICLKNPTVLVCHLDTIK